MTSRQIKLFLSVAESLNFTKVSLEHHISQPTASRQIAQLEEELGVVLFYREKSGIRLTAAGQVLAVQLRQLMQQFEQALDMVKNAEKLITGSLSIGYPGYLNADVFIHPVTAKFQKNYPNVEVNAEPATLPVLYDGLARGEYDIIFAYSLDLHEIKNAAHKSCGRVSQMIAMSSTHPLAAKRNLCHTDFSGETFLLPNVVQSRFRAREVIQICRRMHIENITLQNAKSMDDMFLQVRAGEGVALITSDNLCRFDSRYVCVPLPDDELEPVFVAAVWKTDNRRDIPPLYLNMLGE